MRKATLVSVIVVVFLVGSAFGFYLLPELTSRQMYVLAFTQEGACSPPTASGGPVWGLPWAVVLNGHTIVASPRNASLPIPNNTIETIQSDGNLSVIGFYVPNGIYTYGVVPTDYLGQNGTVTINGADTIVTVHPIAIACTTTIAPTST